MSRISEAFTKKRPVLVAYVCMGDPDMQTSVDLVLELSRHGADIVELGVPFSDPIADGPVIAGAAERAIASGTTLSSVIEAAAVIRKRDEVPLVMMTYMNPLYAFGDEGRVAVRAAKGSGIDGLLLVDHPGDVDTPVTEECKTVGLDRIVLLAPTTTAARRRAILHNASGFVYVVSAMGVTGAHVLPFAEARATAVLAKQESGLPTVVGFGIDSAEKAKTMVAGGTGPDGVVVGTAIVRAVAMGGSGEERISRAAKLVSQIRSALDL